MQIFIQFFVFVCDNNIMFSSFSHFTNTAMLSPSMSALFLTGVLFFIIFLLVVVNYKQLMGLEYYKKITLLALVSISIGIHGLLHFGAEMGYGFNPYQGMVL
jgi:glucan phosphoethanolaminetransferase (alkaline phosphatase superfamily)